jgi:hypothetical protein
MNNLGRYHTGGIRITKLLIHETGTYNPQYRRPYDTRMETNTINIFTDALCDVNRYTPGAIGGLANKFISPSATPEKQLTITNGWGERRLRFLMEVTYNSHLGEGPKEIILGYTEFNGISMERRIDPNMRFYVNSIMETRTTTMHGPTGSYSQNGIISGSHVIVDNGWEGAYTKDRDQNMRPTDVYTAMTRLQLHGLDQGDIYDTRAISSNRAIKSNRSNASAANYVSKIFNGYSTAVRESAFGAGEHSIMDAARNKVPEASAPDDPFLSAIMNIRGDPALGNTFTINDLKRLDPNVGNVITAITTSHQTQAITHYAGQTADWGASTIEVSNATILSQSVPGLLMDVALMRIVFKSTNRVVGGGVVTTLMDAQGFSAGDLSNQLAVFVSRLESEILRDISYNNAIDFAIEMHLDMLGETKVSISMGGGPFYDFVTPQFADALMTPVISGINDRVMTVAHDFQLLSEHLVDNHPATRGMRGTQTDFANPFQLDSF